MSIPESQTSWTVTQSPRGSGPQEAWWEVRLMSVLCMSWSYEPQDLNLSALHQAMSGTLALSVLPALTRKPSATIPRVPDEHQKEAIIVLGADLGHIIALWSGSASGEYPVAQVIIA